MTAAPIRARVGWWLRCLADRIDHYGAPKSIGWSFTFEDGRGIVFHQHNHGDVQGCRLWYYGDDSYDRAWIDSDTERRRRAEIADTVRGLGFSMDDVERNLPHIHEAFRRAGWSPHPSPQPEDSS